MAETSDSIRQDIEATLFTLDAKLDRLEEKVRDSVDVGRQAGEHPWLTMGAAVATGYMVGRLITGEPRPNGEPQPSDVHQAGPGLLGSVIALAVAELLRGVIREQLPALLRTAPAAGNGQASNGSRAETEPGAGC